MENRTNEAITCREVRLIGPNGDQLGIFTTREALTRAYDFGMDLVEISPAANPPVCRIMDFGKHKYAETKKKQAAKKNQTVVKFKEIRIRPSIGTHDLKTKLNQIREFISKNSKVKVACCFKGREIAMSSKGVALLEEIIKDLNDVASVDQSVRQDGHIVSTVIVPK